MYIRRTSLLYIALRAILLFTSRGDAFGTINEPAVIGQHCEHERITRAAFACNSNNPVSDGRCFEEMTLHQLAGTSEEEGYVGQGSNGAVGAPDMLDPIPEGPNAHCDNADFLDAVAFGLNDTYPRTRLQATATLQDCANHLRMRFAEGIAAADKITDIDARIVAPEVDISSRDCMFSFPELQMHVFGRSKCSAIEGFGRALHGIQDFYAHSNWADDAQPPFNASNPPGLLRNDAPMFLDLRAENNISEQVPHDLTTGCFGGILTDGPVGKAGHPLEPGSLDCTGRITHHTLNKDNGIIDEVTGKTSKPGPNTPRSDFPGNFERAVAAAIRDSRRQWRYFREEIRRSYGTERGNLMICALVRDNPTVDCYGRRVAILRDAQGNQDRIAEMQVPIQKWLVQEVQGQAHDEGPGEGLTRQNSTKSRGSSNELEKPFRENEGSNSFSLVTEGLDFSTAVTSLLANKSALPCNKTAIVALTSSRDTHLSDQTEHIIRAGKEGIRVHLGLLPPSPLPLPSIEISNDLLQLSKSKEEELINAVLDTGGTYSILHSLHTIPRFLDHVVSRGLTHYDNAGDTATLLLSGQSISDYVTPESEPRRYSFDAGAVDNVIIAVAPLTPRLSLKVAVRHVRRNMVVKDLIIGLEGNATFRAELGIDDIPRTDAWFELEVAHVKGERLVGSGLFEVSIETEKAAKEDDQASGSPNKDSSTSNGRQSQSSTRGNRHDEL
ncbi:hypothetical protein BU24DRAFT_426940 [Aaosphaeria arxii CBS 175.79]|uniref:Peptidase A2 domain-containing protein n=1 Tax=Aaosphaeria arxii CBS 175.79 TaxID=1450172 RepID=A0A6A5XCT6_9PLEO|nr:uncharacterized protein BU24DRAFT_426940 [Aaosphaeria arxii CBS 175.79]KAF2010729.1 hypothetical protein BU24DRAFT_426940 [Aaosphaeria arxii CBS 175.79]